MDFLKGYQLLPISMNQHNQIQLLSPAVYQTSNQLQFPVNQHNDNINLGQMHLDYFPTYPANSSLSQNVFTIVSPIGMNMVKQKFSPPSINFMGGAQLGQLQSSHLGMKVQMQQQQQQQLTKPAEGIAVAANRNEKISISSSALHSNDEKPTEAFPILQKTASYRNLKFTSFNSNTVSNFSSSNKSTQRVSSTTIARTIRNENEGSGCDLMQLESPDADYFRKTKKTTISSQSLQLNEQFQHQLQQQQQKNHQHKPLVQSFEVLSEVQNFDQASSSSPQWMLESRFFAKPDEIFKKEYQKQFTLRVSSKKNDDITFSQIMQLEQIRSAQNLSSTKQFSQRKQPQKHQKISNSKFHNLNKLFMYKLLGAFTLDNLEELDVPGYAHSAILKVIAKLKASTKKMNEQEIISSNLLRKTDFFSHDHYNLLFLHLNAKTISYLARNEFVVYLHKLCFNFDITSSLTLDGSSTKEAVQAIQFINIIKRFCCAVVQNSNMIGSGIQQNKKSSPLQSVDGESKPVIYSEVSEKQHNRTAYTHRALIGIRHLNKGFIIRRF